MPASRSDVHIRLEADCVIQLLKLRQLKSALLQQSVLAVHLAITMSNRFGKRLGLAGKGIYHISSARMPISITVWFTSPTAATDDAHSTLPWTQPDWQAETHAWTRSEMDRIRLTISTISGPIEQPYIRAWFTVMYFPSGNETLYFKATVEYEGDKTAVTNAPSQWKPGYGPEVHRAV